MAKYAFCSRAHGPQKATPLISTTAGWGQGPPVLLRTWQGAGTAASVKRAPSHGTAALQTPVRRPLDGPLEGVARAEGRDLLGRDLHLLAGLGVPALPGLALAHGELPEAHDPDLFSALERLRDDLLENPEVPLGLALGHASLLGDLLDELRLVHGLPYLPPTFRSAAASLGFLTPRLYGKGRRFPPPTP